MKTQDVFKKVQQVGGGLALLSAAGVAYAVARRLNHRRGYERPFDPKKIVEVKGEVIEVSNSQENKDEKHGVYLILAIENEQIPVHLGPLWYITRQPHHFKEGDKIEVKGSKVTFKNTEIIVASEIRKEKMQMRLRDENGAPMWQSWRKVS